MPPAKTTMSGSWRCARGMVRASIKWCGREDSNLHERKLTRPQRRGELLSGEPPSPLARAVAAAGFANGLSWILPFDEWLFVNTELTVHLHREPEGEWIALDARTTSDASGISVATAILHDLQGPFGVCAQALFVERR
jgi:acyl-Coa thioesterase superfamily protein